jgi:hypothetical protein
MAAPSAIQFYAENLNVLKATDLTGATINMLLTTSTYVPDSDNVGHKALADITNELANGQGYTTGGVALAAPTIADFSTTGYKFSTGNASWTASGSGIPAWRYGVIYVVGSLWGITSPLLGYFTGDSAPADVPLTAAGNTLQINTPANGWFTITRT